MQARCQCGALTAEIAEGVDPMSVVCHCDDCRRRTGSAFGALAYVPESAVALHGMSTEFTRETDAGNRFTTGFCPTCGTPLYGRPSKYPGMIGIAVGTIEGDVALPLRSVYERSMHPWVSLAPEMDHHPVGKDS